MSMAVIRDVLWGLTRLARLTESSCARGGPRMARLSRPRSRWPPGSLPAAPRPGGRRGRPCGARDGRGQQGPGRLARALATRTAAWLGASCLALGLASVPATAEGEVLVSNINQPLQSGGFVVTSSVTAAQGFRTGTNTSGYELTSVDLHVHTAPSNSADVTVSIYSAVSGNPGVSRHTLVTPGTITAGANTFAAPTGTFLAAETPYFVVVDDATTSIDFRLSQTTSDAEGSNAGGWTIENGRLWKSAGDWTSQANAHLITVNGADAPAAPTISTIQFTSDPGPDDTYGIDDDVEVTVTFSRDITLDTSGGTPELELNVGGSAKGAECAAHATALDSLVCTYEVAENDGDANGIAIGANSLTLEGGTIKDVGGITPGNIAHSARPSNPAHKVNGDPTVPTITGVAITSTALATSIDYGRGEDIEVSITFSLPVWRTGGPATSLLIGGTGASAWRPANYHAGNGTRTLRFRYRVVATDTDGNGVQLRQNGLSDGGNVNNRLHGNATIRSSAGIDANVAHAGSGPFGVHRVNGALMSGQATPNAPTNIIATADGANEIDLAWTRPTWPGTSAITEYHVDSGPTASGPWTRAGTATETSFAHTGLNDSTPYHYRVRAVNSSGNGAWSGTANATTAADLVCGRTAQVRDAIVAATPAETCAKVTATQLGEINSLDASEKAIGALAVGDFAGLTGLRRLDLSGNQIPGLPNNVFAELGALKTLDVSDNTMTTLRTHSFSGLSSLTRLNLSENDLSALPPGVFALLTALTELNLSRETLERVPEAQLSGVFSGLPLTSLDLRWNDFSELPAGTLTGLTTTLATLRLGGNTVDPLPVIVDLEFVERAKFKAVIPAGAPFATAVPITVTGGTLDGTPATVTVNAGTRDSAERTVSPSDPRTGAVTVTVGTLPARPSGHSGYVLQASDDLPLTVVSAPATVTIEAEAGQVLATGWNSPDFTLTRTPVSGSIDVDVAIVESDTLVAGGSQTKTVTFADGEATASLSLIPNKVPSGDATITATVQDGADNTAGTPATATINVQKIDPAITFSIVEESVTAEEGEPIVATLMAITSEGVDQPDPSGNFLAVSLSTRKDTATPDDDYITLSKVTPVEDDVYEGDETLGLLLERSAGLVAIANIADATPRAGYDANDAGQDDAVVTITDDDPPPPPLPPRVVIGGASGGSMSLEWFAPEIHADDEITGYQIEWSSTGNDPWHVITDFEELASCGRDVCGLHLNLEPNTIYR